MLPNPKRVTQLQSLAWVLLALLSVIFSLKKNFVFFFLIVDECLSVYFLTISRLLKGQGFPGHLGSLVLI